MAEMCIRDRFWECFRERTANCWETFAEMEAELRQMMDEDKDHTRGAELVAQMEGALNQAFDEISFEMGFNLSLIHICDGNKVAVEQCSLLRSRMLFLGKDGVLYGGIWAVSYTHLDVYKRQATE